MSIKIDGTKGYESIFKEKDGSEVRVMPSLFLNGTEITASGGGSTDPGDTEEVCEFKTCGIYPASSYANYDKVKVNVSNWETVEVPDNYYEINSNGEYNVSKFTRYAGIVVTKASEPEPMPEVDPINFTFATTDIIAKPTRNFSTSFSGSVDFNNYNVDINIPLKLSYSCESADSTREEISSSVELTHNSLTSTGFIGTCSLINISLDCYEYIITISGTIKLDSTSNTVTCSISAAWEKHPAYESVVVPGITFKFGLIKSSGTIYQAPKTPVSTLSLRSTTNLISQPAIYENLVVNNDALVQGNLSVNGYINDLLWYWDSMAINAIETDLGTGFLAKITDLTFKLNNEQILVPTLQLSSGSSYKESNYSIIWTPTGALKIDADDITEISGSIQILRYA